MKSKILLKVVGSVAVFIIISLMGIVGFWLHQGWPLKILPAVIVRRAVFLKDEIPCNISGGIWQVNDAPGANYYCNPPTNDGGKVCADPSECESYCQAKADVIIIGSETIGECYGWKEVTKGCMSEVKNGIFRGTWCY